MLSLHSSLGTKALPCGPLIGAHPHFLLTGKMTLPYCPYRYKGYGHGRAFPGRHVEGIAQPMGASIGAVKRVIFQMKSKTLLL